LPLASKTATNTRWNVYAFPAAISVGLLLLETVYLAIKLPETKDYKKSQQLEEKPAMGVNEGKVKESVEVRRQRLKKLGRLHGFFLLFFSGVSGFHVPSSKCPPDFPLFCNRAKRPNSP
jgi:hypothetical protein